MEVCAEIEPMKSPKKDLTSPNVSSKGLKQVRLPFKQLDQKIVSPVTSGKKRKLSSGESSASKITKTISSITPKSSGKLKHPVLKNENEVSSSSEAENIPMLDTSTSRKSTPRVIEKLLEAAQQREVSTSGELIDLTSEHEENEGDISGVTVQDIDDLEETTKDEKTVCKSDTTSMEVEKEVSKNLKLNQKSPAISSDKKVAAVSETKSLKKPAPKLEDLFSAAKTPKSTKRSGDEMVTPAKVLKTSEKKTPGSAGSPSEMTSPSSADPVLKTPTNISEKKATSSKKKHEKDAERQKKKEEKEKEKLDKQKQRDEAKAERERKKQEEKDKKEQERLQKEKEKQEKKELVEKERLDKLKQKEDEKQKKLEASEEEKRKKEEDKKKKDDERRQKEDEKKKEEEEKNSKAKKAKAAFSSFFIKSDTSPTPKPASREETGLFRGFYVNKDMTLAPSKRAHSQLEGFDTEFESQDSGTLYLEELREGSRKPVKTEQYNSLAVNGADDVVVLKEEKEDIPLKDIGDPEKEEGCPKIMKAKFLKFRENNRPAYRGTWRKKSQLLTPRNPFKKDKDLFDYEYDSDDDWEEEEPGESLSNSEGEGDDEEEKPSNEAVVGDDDDDEDGFFVPHGYLSEDEGGDEEEEACNPEKMKALQVAKAKAFEMEIKRKCEYMRAVVIGCCWMNATDRIPEVYSRLEAYQAVPMSTTPILTACNKMKPATNEATKPKSKGLKKPVPKEALPDLIKYIHCSVLGLHKIVRGFRAQWHKKMHPEPVPSAASKPEPADVPMDVAGSPSVENSGNKTETGSPATDKIPESEHEMSIRQLELKIASMATYQRGPQHYRKCWYVKPEILKEFSLEELQEKVVKRELNKNTDKKDLNKSTDGSQPPCATPEAATPKSSKNTPSVTITQFTVKADPEAKWHIEKPTPKPSPAPQILSPAPVASSPALTGKASARRIQLTMLTNFMIPKTVKCDNQGSRLKNIPSGGGAKGNILSLLSPKNSTPQLEKTEECPVIDLTDELSNDGVAAGCNGESSGAPTDVAVATLTSSIASVTEKSNNVEMVYEKPSVVV